MTIGVLALQGDFAEHIAILQSLHVNAVEVRTIADAEQIEGLIIPGGESTAIGKLLRSSKLNTWIKRAAKQGLPIYGTCAGCILIAKEVDSEYSLQLIDIDVSRNAFGRQRDSFETTLQSTTFPKLLGTFIRAPRINSTLADTVDVLASFDDEAVLVKQGNILAGTFHPELHNDTRVHAYFVDLVKAAGK